MISRIAYCSWCFHLTEHEPVKSAYGHTVYTCKRCGNQTVCCIRCKHMAVYETWHNRLCAKHSGIIKRFRRFYDIENLKLKSLLDYNKVLEHKYWMVDSETFKVHQLTPGQANSETEPVIIAIDGFLTEGVQDAQDWQLEQLFPSSPCYYLSWESKNLRAIGKSIGIPATIKGLEAVAARIALTSVARFSPIGWAMLGYSLVDNPWRAARNAAKRSGIVLADLLARTNQEYILIGHSLGARVIYYTLKSLAARYPGQPRIQQVHLLGGATGNNPEKWARCTQAVNGNIYNYYSQNDDVLKILYTAGTAFTSSPIGRNEIVAPGIINCNATAQVKGHTDFKPNFVSLYKVAVS